MKTKDIVSIIGFGNMGEALGRALADNGWKVLVYDKFLAKSPAHKNVYFLKTPEGIVENSPVLILAVKPQELGLIIEDHGPALQKHKPLIVSIAAGVSTGFFEKQLKSCRIIRAMPNLAAKKRMSLSFLSAGKQAKKADKDTAVRIFSCVGEAEFIEERFLDKVTAVTGSGPGYVFYFMDCLYKGARSLGFSPATAKKMVLKTFLGALELARSSDEEFEQWVNRVTSKGGTTRAALDVLDSAKCPAEINKALKAAAKRAQQLNIK